MDAFSLDIRTMAAMASLASVLQAIALGVLWRTAPQAAGPAHWAVGGALLAVGMILIAFRSLIPDLLSVVLANVLIAGSHAAYLTGIQKYLGLPLSKTFCAIVVGATAGLFVAFTYIQPDIAIRVVLISAAVAALSGACVFQFFRKDRRSFADVELLLVALFVLHGVFQAFRGVYTGLADHGLRDFMSASIIHGMAFVDIVIFCFAVGIGFSVATVLAMNKALQSELEARSTLLSIIAHDVRTPFNGLVGSTHLIQSYLERGKTEEVARFANLLSREAETVLRLLEDLITWGRAQFADAQLSNTTLSLRTLVDDAMAPLKKEAEAKHLSIETSFTAAETMADKNIVAMALRNFLSNAIKFSPDHGVIRIDATETGSGTDLAVSDDGPGLGPDMAGGAALDARDLAAHGLQGERTHTGRGGLGVGLSLCARTCARLGYGLTLANGKSGGVVGTLHIPRV